MLASTQQSGIIGSRIQVGPELEKKVLPSLQVEFSSDQIRRQRLENKSSVTIIITIINTTFGDIITTNKMNPDPIQQNVGIHHSPGIMQTQIDFYEELARQFDDTRTRLQGLKQELSAHEKVMSLLSVHIQENQQIQKRLVTNNEDDRKQAIVKESYDKLLAKYERFRVAKLDREDDYKKLLTEKNRLESTLNSMKTQIASIKKFQQTQENNTLFSNSNNTTRQQPTNEPAFDYDVETINFLNECNWNLGESCDRNLAETLLSCFPNGTFLVRSSKTKQNSYVLSVVIDSKVRHCLVDKINDEYCFHPPRKDRQFYSSLCNLVMDYRHQSLAAHNPELVTNLIYPVLSQLKKTSKGSAQAVGQYLA